MNVEDLQPQITPRIELNAERRKLPQELCDLVISHAPQEVLSECSLVCRDWVRSSSRRLFDKFIWPPKSVYALEWEDSRDYFSDFLEALAVSTRLQDAIHSLQLGRVSSLYIRLPRPAYEIRVSTLISILGLCPRLDDIILRYCDIHAPDIIIEASRFDGLDIVTLVCCPTLNPSNMQGLMQFLSLFKRINHLSITFQEPVYKPIEQSLNLCFPKTVELRSISWVELPDHLSPEIENAPLYFLGHLRQISNIPETLHSLSAGSAPYNLLEYLRNMNHLEVLEIYMTSPYTREISAIRNIHSLRRLVLHCRAQLGDFRQWWPSVMVNLGDTPSHLQHLFITLRYVKTHRRRMDETLDLFEKRLLKEDWQSLERFTERCPSVSVELRVRALSAPGVAADPDRVVEITRNVASKCLSKRALKAISVKYLGDID